MRKKIMTLMMGMLLLLTACGQTGSNSASTMLPVAEVRSAAQAIAPTEDKVQEDVDSLLGEENTEEAEPAGGEDTPKLANMAMGHKRDDHEDEQLHHVNDNAMQ